MQLNSRSIRRMMRTLTHKIFHKDPNIVFRITEPQDKLKVIELESFVFRKVLLNKLCKVSVADHFEIMKDDVHKKDEHKISTLAIEKQTQRVISGCRLEPYSDYFNPETLLTPQKNDPMIAQLISNLDSHWNDLFKAKGLEPNPSEFVYIKTGFTHDDYHGKGIFPGLWEYTEELLKSKGYKYVFSLMVSKPVQKVRIQKFGFEVLKDLPYAEMPVYGEFPFREIVAREPQYKDERVLFGFKELK